jgi:chromosome segregation protein
VKVSRIEIFGFKSFLEKLVLPLDGGITAVVGPNGCGKSNLVDALRWVFGETRASQLRGALLEDVIFNGTETLRPLGLAEVSLVISTDKASLRDDILEGRFHSASEEELNAVNAQDSSIAFKDFAGDKNKAESAAENYVAADNSGRPHLTVIEGALSTNHKQIQEQATEMVPEIKQEAQEPKQQDAALDRFAWLKLSREVEVTRRLYRSGESEFFINKVPCRLRDLKELFRLLGLGARSYTLVAQGEVSKIITSKPEERRLMLEEAAGVSGVREKLAAAQRRLEDTKQNVTRLNDLISEVTRQVNSLRVQASRAKNRAELKIALKDLDSKVAADRINLATQKLASISASLSSLSQKESDLRTKLQEANSAEEAVQKELFEFQQQRESLSREVKVLRAQLSEKQAKKQALVSELQNLEHRLAEETKRSVELERRAENIASQILSSDYELESFAKNIQELEGKLVGLEKIRTDDLKAASQDLERSRSVHSKAQNEYQNLKGQFLALQARIDATLGQLKDLSPLKAVANKQGLQEVSNSLSPLLEHIHVEDIYRKALEAALIALPNVMLSDNFDLLVQSLKQSPNLFKDCAQIRVVSSNFKLESTPDAGIVNEKVKSFASCFSINEKYSQTISALFHNFYYAETLDLAFEFAQFKANALVVTQNGELVSANALGFGKEAHGVVELYSRKRQLQAEVPAMQANLDSFQASLAVAKTELEQAQFRHSDALTKSVEADKEIRKIGSETGSMRGKAEVVNRVLRQLKQESEKIEQNRQSWKNSEGSLVQRIDQLKNTLSLPDPQTNITEENLASLEARLDKADADSKELISNLNLRSRSKEALRIEFERATSQKSRAEFEIQKIELESKTAKERFHEFYPDEDVEVVLTLGLLSDSERAGAAHEAERLRTRIVREGEVDPASIELFEKEDARLSELKLQRKDLDAAADTLAATVIELNELAKKRFLETFKIVQENFSKLIPKVFGGGQGSLILEDSSDPFSGGIDVNVRPPGKKPKSIELLSGGERALCAIALIFSMFLHRPSPLCVLDEVDAPLDEANLRRYLEMVQEMSSVTQFMMITHNKEAMAAAHRLVGVTQEQLGASKIVTVSLEQAQAIDDNMPVAV